MSAMDDTPELDFQHLIIDSGQSELLGKFYDWLKDQGYYIAEWVKYDEYVEERLMPIRVSPNQLFANFFNIDLNKIEEERRAILEELRNNND